MSRILPSPLIGSATIALTEGCAFHSTVSGKAGCVPPVLICKRGQGRIINVWLVLTVVLGALIAFADGLTRVPILERQASWNGPLEYEPYWGALLLAAITFPLMLAYACKAGVRLAEALFLWFVFCTTAYTRDFSYIRWPGTPLFITEVVLLILLLSIYLVPRRHGLRTPLPVRVLLVLLVTAGMLAAMRGFLGHRDPVFVLRDLALVAYPLFLLVAHNLLGSWLSIKRMAIWFLLGTALGALGGLGWFIAAPGERRFIYFGIYILISLAGILVAITHRWINPGVGWVSAGVFCVGLMLANARSLFVALVALLLLAFLAGRSVYGSIRIASFIRNSLAMVVLVTLAAEGPLFP